MLVEMVASGRVSLLFFLRLFYMANSLPMIITDHPCVSHTVGMNYRIIMF